MWNQKLWHRLRWRDGKEQDAREIRVRAYLDSRLDRHYRPAWARFEAAVIAAAPPLQYKKGDRVQWKRPRADTLIGRRIANRHGTVIGFSRPWVWADDDGTVSLHRALRVRWDGTKTAQDVSDEKDLRPAGGPPRVAGVPKRIQRMRVDCYPPLFADACVLRGMEFAESRKQTIRRARRVLADTAWVNDLLEALPS
jgi:hypothetical protein